MKCSVSTNRSKLNKPIHISFTRLILATSCRTKHKKMFRAVGLKQLRESVRMNFQSIHHNKNHGYCRGNKRGRIDAELMLRAFLTWGQAWSDGRG
jgi:hypothetical protein